MSIACAKSVALVGLHGEVVEIEAAVGAGLPRTVLLGLPDTSLYEARDRCRAAVASSGMAWPQSLLTLNLQPATLPKTGSHYDLGIVAAVLAAGGAVPPDPLRRCVLLGELGLDGRVRRVRGVLPALLAAQRVKIRHAIVAAEQVAEARLVEGLRVSGVTNLADLVEVLHGRSNGVEPPEATAPAEDGPQVPDLAEVVGQLEAKWALEVAAAGRHHMFLHGPPGVGKTMLAERLPGLLPPLDRREALEVSALHSLAGVELNAGLVIQPPYAAPHHSASMVSLIGGGSRMARPGAISLAHRGVLFLDEAPEFAPRALDALRTPLEAGSVTIARRDGPAHYPASFQLVLAANPCPCGLAETPGAECTCAPMTIRRYAERISGPITDRIDIHTHLQPLKRALLRCAAEQTEPSAAVAERVAQARERQLHRLSGTGWRTNAEVPGSYLRGRLKLPDGLELFDEAVARGRLSARGVDRCLRLCWTLADLAGLDRPGRDQVRLALAMRRGEHGWKRDVA